MRRYVDLVVEVVSDAVPDAAASLSRRLTALSNGVGPITPVSSQPSSPTRSGLRLVVDPIAVDVTAPVQEGEEVYPCGCMIHPALLLAGMHVLLHT